MKMDKQIYSRKLMGEAMRQVRLPGIIGLLLLSGMTFFSTFIRIFDAMDYGSVIVLNRVEQSVYSMLVMYIIAPLMVIMLFGFMNRRRASDFYHALPYSRLCMYISLMAAVFVWCIIIVAVCFMTTIVIVLASHKLQIDYTSAAKAAASAAAGCILTMSVTALAMTLTGTYLTNIIATLVILFVPRFLIFVCNHLFSVSLPFVVLKDSSFFGNQGNIPFALITGIFGVLGNTEAFTSFKPAIYSGLLGIVYAAIGAVFFVKRKSENAMQASINRGLQCVFRMIPAVMISLIAISVMYNAYTSGSAIKDSDKFIVIMTYVACVAVYFLYEIITTRKVRRIYRTIPGLAVVFAVNALLYFSLCHSYDYHISQLPDKQELEYVVVYGPDDDVFWQDTKNVKLYSEAARAVAGDCLKDTVNLWLNKRDSSPNGYYGLYYSGNMTVEYHYMNGKSITRHVIVNETRYAQLQKALINEDDFAAAFGKQIFSSENLEYYVGCLDEGSEGAKKVLDTFVTELKEKGISNYFDVIDERKSAESVFQISMLKRDVYNYSAAYIGFNMPRTLAAYINELNKAYPANALESFAKLSDKVRADLAETSEDILYTNSYIGLNLYTFMPDGSVVTTRAQSYANNSEYYYELMSEEGIDYIRQLGSILESENVDASDITKGIRLLVVEYYEDTAADDIIYSETEENVQSRVLYGGYIVDKRAEELVKKISREEIISVDQ